MKKFLLVLSLIIGLASITALVLLYRAQPQMFQDPSFDTEPPVIKMSGTTEGEQPAILVFSKTNGFRHKEGIPAALELFETMAEQQGWQIFMTENGAVHNEQDLARFDVVVWANASGPLLLPKQRTALRSFIENGGGFVAIHAAGDGSHKSWKWYQDTILGAAFIGHTMVPHQQDATIVKAADHPVIAKLPAQWQHNDEWYAFDRSPAPAGAKVLLNVDESSYEPGKYSMKPNHPVVWVREPGKGRSLYSALGHSAQSFQTPEYQQLLMQAVQWTGRLNFDADSRLLGDKK